MKKQIIFFSTLFILYSCNTDKEKSNETKLNQKSKNLASCYLMEGNAGIVAFQIEQATNPITGKLVYSLAEKDRNQGSFSGSLKGDILKGTYTFQSEGKESSRESIFLVKDGQLIEGFGEIETEGNTSKFKDVGSLSFDGSITLSSTDCESLAASCIFDFGKVKSNLIGDCIEPSQLEIKLNPLKDGAMTQCPPAFVLFNEDRSKVEIFFGVNENAIILNKTNEGSWNYNDYNLISWKGYVLQQNGVAIFGGL